VKRIVIVIVVCGLLIGVIFVGGALGIGYFLAPQSPLSQSDAIVAVSGGETDARTREAIKLYKENYGRSLIFSGAAQDTNGPSNAEAMRRQALEAGIPSGSIFIDERSANTSQNADAVSQIVKQESFHKLILVTSPYHQRRASITFKRALGPDVTILNHSAPDQSWRRSHWWANPYSYALTLSELQKTVFLIITGSK
jgi:uncharacterized SAM-binding protein YcdF (DUF218 family)